MSALQKPDPELATDTIRLTPMTQASVGDSWRMVQDADVKRFTYMPSDADEAFVSGWIARYEAGWVDGSRAGFEIRDAGDDAYLGFVAIVTLDLADEQGEIGYMLAPEARGRGAASAALDLVTRWGIEQLGLERLELRIDAANTASQRVAERAGYRLDGVLRSLAFKDGRRVDTGVWSRLPGDRLTV